MHQKRIMTLQVRLHFLIYMNHPINKGPEQHISAQRGEEAVCKQRLPGDVVLVPAGSGLHHEHDEQHHHRQNVEHEAVEAGEA